MWFPLLLIVAVATAQNPDQCPPVPDNVQVSMDQNGCTIYTVTCPAGNTVSTMGPSTSMPFSSSQSSQSSESSTLSSESSSTTSTPSTAAPSNGTASPSGSSTVTPSSSSVTPTSTNATVVPGETTTAPVNPSSSTQSGSTTTIEGSPKTVSGEGSSTAAAGPVSTSSPGSNATMAPAPGSSSSSSAAVTSATATASIAAGSTSSSAAGMNTTAAPAGSTAGPTNTTAAPSGSNNPGTNTTASSEQQTNATSSTSEVPSSSTAQTEGNTTATTTMASSTTTTVSTTTTAISVPPGCTIPDAPTGCQLMRLEELDVNGCPTFTAICLPEVCDVDTCPLSMICKEMKNVCLEEPCPPPFTCLDNAVSLRFLDEMLIPRGFSLNGVKFGGNAGLAYNIEKDYFYVLRLGSEQVPPAFMTIMMRIDKTGFCTLEIMVPVTPLTNPNGAVFDSVSVRPSSIVFLNNHLFWSTQEEGGVRSPHSIRRMGLNGVEMERLAIPQSHVMQFDENNTQIAGVQKGLGFGGLSVIPPLGIIFGINRGPLAQDILVNSNVQYVRATGYQVENFTSDANSTLGTPGNFSSILVEYLWPIDAPPMGFLTQEVADVVCLDEQRAIILETATDLDKTQFRSFLYLMTLFDSTFNNVTNQTSTFEATPVTGVQSIRDLTVDAVNGPVFPLRKTFLQEISDRTLDLSKGMDYFENLAEGKPLEDGRRVLISGTNDENGFKRISTSITWTFDKIVGEQDQF